MGFLRTRNRHDATGTAGKAGGRRKGREIAAIVGAAAIAVAVLSVVPLALDYLRDSPPQEAKVDELIREARTGAWGKAYMCTTDHFRKAVTLKEFRSAVQFLPGFGSNETHELRWNGEHSDRLGMVNATLHAPDGRDVTARFAVYRTVIGSDWLVADVEVGGHSLFDALLYR